MNSYLRFCSIVVCCLLYGNALQSAEPIKIGIDTVLTPRASIGNTLWVRVDSATRSGLASRSIDYSKVRLFLNGVQFSTMTPQMKAPDVLAFSLVYDSATARAWRLLLGTKHTRERTVRVAISTSDIPMHSQAENTTMLVLYSTGMFVVALVSVLLVVLVIVVLGRRTALLRDGDKTTSYSLAQCQMALWFVLVFAAYLFIALLTNQWDGIINNTVLVLVGLGAATPAAATAVQTMRETRAAPQPTQSFIVDILSDGTKERLHRLQYVVWTIALGGVFCWTVWNNLAMPAFSTELLLLLGISSGAYVTLRETE